MTNVIYTRDMHKVIALIASLFTARRDAERAAQREADFYWSTDERIRREMVRMGVNPDAAI